MTTNPFAPATRDAVKARIALTGPAGSGKTYSALAIATELADKVAVIDTEHGRAREYATPTGPFSFDHLAPASFDPRDLCKLLAVAAEHDYGCVIIDSLSHYWMGIGGALEIVDNASAANRGNGMAGWKEYGPIERRMVDAMLAFPGHIIATMRVKTAYSIEPDERGRSAVRKVGLEPEQRKGMDYEFSLVGEMDREHRMTVTKSTCPTLVDEVVPRPGADVAAKLKAWMEGGTKLPDAREYRDQALKPDTSFEDLRDMMAQVRGQGLAGAMLMDEHGDETTLGDLIIRLGRERKAVAA
jgi:hypothetical protein